MEICKQQIDNFVKASTFWAQRLEAGLQFSVENMLNSMKSMLSGDLNHKFVDLSTKLVLNWIQWRQLIKVGEIRYRHYRGIELFELGANFEALKIKKNERIRAGNSIQPTETILWHRLWRL